MLLAKLVETSATIAGTRSRLAKIGAIADLLRRAEHTDVPVVVDFLSGKLSQRRTGVGWAAFRDPVSAASTPTLSVADVDQAFATIEAISGVGSSALRRRMLSDLLSRATGQEQKFIQGLVSGELRQGALAGIMAEAVGVAWDVPRDEVRRAAMLSGNLAVVAKAAAEGGSAAMGRFHLRVGVPIQPMLAQPGKSLADALERAGHASVEWKLDGVRVQVHKRGEQVDVFTRTLDRITRRVPEVVEVVQILPATEVILDGEAIALAPDGRPRPFQVTGSRIATGAKDDEGTTGIRLNCFFFDVLHVDGQDLIDLPLQTRLETLAAICGAENRVRQMSAQTEEDAADFAREALEQGHEGVMVKSLASPYEAGRRGTSWIKVKPHHTLDLVVLAVERGHGRRQGWLSNLHLGALDASTGEFVMLGKTFKGLTDEMLRRQTEQLGSRVVKDDGWTVHVRPELVVEIAFDGIQTSPRYPAGMALRFARVVRYRDDKRPEEADTVETVRRIYESASL